MWPFLIFVSYLAAAYILGALIEYPVYALIKHYTDISFYTLAGHGFMLVGLAGLYFLLKPLNLNNKTALGYALP